MLDLAENGVKFIEGIIVEIAGRPASFVDARENDDERYYC